MLFHHWSPHVRPSDTSASHGHEAWPPWPESRWPDETPEMDAKNQQSWWLNHGFTIKKRGNCNHEHIYIYIYVCIYIIYILQNGGFHESTKMMSYLVITIFFAKPSVFHPEEPYVSLPDRYMQQTCKTLRLTGVDVSGTCENNIQWIGLFGKIYRKPMGFYHQI